MTMITVCSEYVDGLKRFAEAAIWRCRDVEAQLNAVRAEAGGSLVLPDHRSRVGPRCRHNGQELSEAQAESDAAEAAEFRASVTRLAKELDDAFVNPGRRHAGKTGPNGERESPPRCRPVSSDCDAAHRGRCNQPGGRKKSRPRTFTCPQGTLPDR